MIDCHNLEYGSTRAAREEIRNIYTLKEAQKVNPHHLIDKLYIFVL